MGIHEGSVRPPSARSTSPRLVRGGTAVAVIGAIGLLASLWLTPQPAYAIGTVVPLGVADSYSALGGQSVTNTGPTVIDGDVGVSPGTAIDGFDTAVIDGDTHAADAHALQAQADLTIAYDDAAGQAPDASVSGDLGNSTLLAGVYNASSSIGLTGPLTLDAEGDPNAVFIFQIGSELTTASSSSVLLLNGAQACNVFWQIGSSATLGTGSTFVGTIMALTSITVTTGTTVDGRALARNGSVTLDTNVFTSSTCDRTPTEPTTEPTDATTEPTEPPTDATTEPSEPPSETPTVAPTDTPSATATSTDAAPVPVPSGTSSDTGGSNPGTPGNGGNPGLGSDGDLTGGDDRLPETGASSSTPHLLTAAIVTLLAGIMLVMVGLPRSRRRH
ncbi:ice-binding family protein [Pseudactinotalea suaedae]|uniref:ice-binding family protein n=1 Tax=Pseudactinotalea suaedae TaxID=1524924 RepID=UPI0012E2842A|nr:ice-binding family protein [Pseudactinotalea suaedae]